MVYDAPHTFLELRAGPYRLALDAQTVVSVVSDATASVGVSHDDQSLPFADLSECLAGQPRASAPFAVVFESPVGRAAVGVDAVDHLRPGDDATVRPVPGFGLRRAALFAGALDVDGGLVLLLDASALAQLTASKERDI